MLISPKTNYLKCVLRAAGNPVKRGSITKAGIGTISIYGALSDVGFVSMQVKGDYKKMCARMEKAWVKLTNLTSMGVILPGFTDEWMRQQGYVVRFSMYFLNQQVDLEQFISVKLPLTQAHELTRIFRLLPAAAPAQPKKRKKAPLAKGMVLKERKVDVEEAKRDEEACLVCMDMKITHMCLPCQHFVMCGTCADTIKDDKSICPVCRHSIDAFATPIGK